MEMKKEYFLLIYFNEDVAVKRKKKADTLLLSQNK